MKKSSAFICLLVFMSVFCAAQSKNFQVYFSSGMSHVFEYGDIEDYVFAENDFPVTPAHNSPQFGISLTYFFSIKLGLELETQFYLPSKVILEDPSDLDTVEIDTSSHTSLSLNFIYKILRAKIQPYLSLGLGIDKILGNDQSGVTEYGYEIHFYCPDKTIDFHINAGGGIQYLLSPRIGIRLDIHPKFILSDPSIKSISPTMGVFLRF